MPGLLRFRGSLHGPVQKLLDAVPLDHRLLSLAQIEELDAPAGRVSPGGVRGAAQMTRPTALKG